jgi:pseudouridine-5'-phosphate glycosidase
MNVAKFSGKMLELGEEVNEALIGNRPVIALESTIIAHGMPYPQNVKTALEVEDLIRKEGAIPATIAILKGKIKCGLTADEIEVLGKAEKVWKTSIADLAYVTASGLNGATTVASTMRIADMCGIRFFVTGGIGGVHREVLESMDISADLTEMSKANVAVISAGIKSILHIGHTLEVLETLGVPVITIGQDEFPSFYSRRSGFSSPFRIDQPSEIARMLKHKWDLGISGSALIANPVPLSDEFPFDIMENHIHDALQEAQAKKISGKKITPFLLAKLAEITGGKSLETNIALVRNNATAGAKISVEFSKMTENPV